MCIRDRDSSYWYSSKSYELYFREMLFAAVEGSWNRFAELDTMTRRFFSKHYSANPPLEALYLRPFNALLLERFSKEQQYDLLDGLLFNCIYELEPIDEITTFLQNRMDTTPMKKVMPCWVMP